MNKEPIKIAIAHYDEIATKGKNRINFEKKLQENIQHKLKLANLSAKVFLRWGFLVVENFSKESEQEIESILSTTPGVATFGIGYKLDEFETIKNIAEELFSGFAGSFAARVKRIDKSYPKTSQELEKELGSIVLEKVNNLKVNLTNPEKTIVAEIYKKNEIYVYIKQKGLGGLPVGSSGKGVFLLSGGFDSPVASFLLINRGVEPVFLHFHSVPQTSPRSIQKVKQIAQTLTNYAGNSILVLVGFLDVMRYIHNNLENKDLKMVMLRRSFFKAAEKIAEQFNADLISTGDSLGQVASQTIQNMHASSFGVETFVARPLIGFSKEKIINLSKEIKTHDISVQPHDDSCALFVPKHPATKASLKEVLEEERKLTQLEPLIKDALSKAEKLVYHYTPKHENIR